MYLYRAVFETVVRCVYAGRQNDCTPADQIHDRDGEDDQLKIFAKPQGNFLGSFFCSLTETDKYTVLIWLRFDCEKIDEVDISLQTQQT